MMERIHGRLPAALCAAIDALIVVPDDATRSRLEEMREAAPEPTPDAIDRFLRRAESLRDLELALVDLDGLSGITASVVAHYAEFVHRYDGAHLRRFGAPKVQAMVACFLVEREKSLLDDLVTMYHGSRSCRGWRTWRTSSLPPRSNALFRRARPSAPDRRHRDHP